MYFQLYKAKRAAARPPVRNILFPCTRLRSLSFPTTDSTNSRGKHCRNPIDGPAAKDTSHQAANTLIMHDHRSCRPGQDTRTNINQRRPAVHSPADELAAANHDWHTDDQSGSDKQKATMRSTCNGQYVIDSHRSICYNDRPDCTPEAVRSLDVFPFS